MVNGDGARVRPARFPARVYLYDWAMCPEEARAFFERLGVPPRPCRAHPMGAPNAIGHTSCVCVCGARRGARGRPQTAPLSLCPGAFFIWRMAGNVSHPFVETRGAASLTACQPTTPFALTTLLRDVVEEPGPRSRRPKGRPRLSTFCSKQDYIFFGVGSCPLGMFPGAQITVRLV